jgi:hypothetical protein
MGLEDIQTELSYTPRILGKGSAPLPTSLIGSQVYAAIVGDVIDATTIAAMVATAAQVTTLSRKPAGSTAAVVTHAFTCDLPGAYDWNAVVVAKAFATRHVVFPPSFLTTPYGGPTTTPRLLTRAHLQAWASAAPLATITAVLEVATPSFASLWTLPGAAGLFAAVGP